MRITPQKLLHGSSKSELRLQGTMTQQKTFVLSSFSVNMKHSTQDSWHEIVIKSVRQRDLGDSTEAAQWVAFATVRIKRE